MTFFDFMIKFPTQDSIIKYLIDKVFNGVIVCPKCGHIHKVYKCGNRLKVFHCKNCNQSFSIFTNTIFENTHCDLRKWFFAIHLILNDKKGVSGYNLQRETGVTYKTAWRINHQIRKAMSDDNFKNKFSCIVEIDETYVGGKPRAISMDSDLPKNKRGRGSSKTPIVGIRERNTGNVYAKVMLPNKEGKCLSGKQLFKILSDTCDNDTIIMTDEFRGYNNLDHKNPKNFIRLSVNHSQQEYSKGNGIHTNGIESFWSNIKRGVYGVFHHISVKYMQNYIDEFCYRTNHCIKKNCLVEIDVINSLLKDCLPFKIREHLYKSSRYNFRKVVNNF